MYAYIDRKKKFPVTTLLRAIGYDSDKNILELFDLADEVKVSKSGLKKQIGRKLAARVLRKWVEDFVDEDTGAVVSIDRNELILERETILERSEEHTSELQSLMRIAYAVLCSKKNRLTDANHTKTRPCSQSGQYITN